MNREQVVSSAIKSVGYDATTQTLEVEFLKGSVYQYRDVPISLYTEFMNASSKGKFHYNHIMRKFYYSRTR